MKRALIFDAIRTPRGKGKNQGSLSQVPPIDLLAPLFKALEKRNHLDSAQVEDVILGCVTSIGEQGANIAKIGSLYAHWHNSVSGMTLNRFCTSGLEACNLAALKIQAGQENLVVAGGVESMSRVPLGSDQGAWLVDPKVMKATGAIHMGISADLIASLEGFKRNDLDLFALQSHQRAASAQSQGYFHKSLIPVTDPEGKVLLECDELVRPETTLETLGRLNPYFEDLGRAGGDLIALTKYPTLKKIDHHHHAGNSPAIADGASLVLVGSEVKGKELGLRPRAEFRAMAVASAEPVIMLTGAIEATRKVLRQSRLRPSQIDLFEVNESFSAPVLKFVKDLDIPLDRVNVNGGAISLGHPLGATGGMLIGTMIDELERRDLKWGLIAMCGGAGLGVATLIERL